MIVISTKYGFLISRGLVFEILNFKAGGENFKAGGEAAGYFKKGRRKLVKKPVGAHS